MAIISTDIHFQLSGGASNADPLVALGGAKSSVVAGSNFFDNIDAATGLAGQVDYRCVYVSNVHGSLTLIGAVAWLLTNTASTDTTIDIGIGTSALNATEQTIANKLTAPSGVTFGPAASKGAGLALGDIPAGGSRAVWFRRTVNAGAAASNDTATPRVEGSTTA
jgi:hypothetical protein